MATFTDTELTLHGEKTITILHGNQLVAILQKTVSGINDSLQFDGNRLFLSAAHDILINPDAESYVQFGLDVLQVFEPFMLTFTLNPLIGFRNAIDDDGPVAIIAPGKTSLSLLVTNKNKDCHVLIKKMPKKEIGKLTVLMTSPL